MSQISPTSPIQQRDIRSAAKPFKRDRDADSKWANGTRPLGGVKIRYSGIPGREEPVDPLLEKVRPVKALVNSHAKNHGNKAKPASGNFFDFNTASNRMGRKIDAVVESNDHTASPLSKSLLELLPQHANNTTAAIQTTIRDSSFSRDEGILYSFDSESGPMGLDALVEKAEKKWIAEQTERIVKGEYEVLDEEGETTILKSKKGKKGSPRQKAVKTMPSTIKDVNVEEDDGFELI